MGGAFLCLVDKFEYRRSIEQRRGGVIWRNYGGTRNSFAASAITLAIGIGLQNFPGGIAVAMPLRREETQPGRAFMYEQASGIVEPIAGVIGAAAVLTIRPLLPYGLAFAAGAIVFVVTEEVIPESQCEGNADLATKAS